MSTEEAPVDLQRIEIVDPDMARVLAGKTEAERLRIAWGMWRSTRRMLTRIVQAEDTSRTDDEIRAEVSRRLARGT